MRFLAYLAVSSLLLLAGCVVMPGGESAMGVQPTPQTFTTSTQNVNQPSSQPIGGTPIHNVNIPDSKPLQPTAQSVSPAPSKSVTPPEVKKPKSKPLDPTNKDVQTPAQNMTGIPTR